MPRSRRTTHQTKPLFEDSRWRDQLYCGDSLSVLDVIPNQSVDLIYIDPPFYSQRYYEVIWGESAERFAFEDRWSGGINHYLEYLLERIRKMHGKLKETGTFFIHLDWHIVHYMKVELDKIFGYGNFRNQIIWKRQTAHSDVKQGARHLGRIHDVILCYSRGETPTWNMQYVPYDQEYVDAFYKHVDSKTGRRYRLSDITGPGGAAKGNPHYEFLGVTRYWRYSKQKMQELYKKGKIIQTRPGTVPAEKRYLDEMPGVPLQDIWTDVPPVALGKERLGYPTQKPLKLLERIVTLGSNPGDVVLDAFCGCGTTLAAAQKLGRRWIGIDISPSAIRVVEQRLRKLGAVRYDVHGMVATEAELLKLSPLEFQNWAINAVFGKHSPSPVGDMGIDGFTFLENNPIQVKQMDNVGRPHIDTFAGVLQREKTKKAMYIAFDFTKGAVDEVARLKREQKIHIELVRCRDLLEGKLSVRQMM
ncbi:MAG: DNA methyltransferase [Candidatus Binatia bacterium]